MKKMLLCALIAIAGAFINLNASGYIINNKTTQEITVNVKSAMGQASGTVVIPVNGSGSLDLSSSFQDPYPCIGSVTVNGVKATGFAICGDRIISIYYVDGKYNWLIDN